MDLRPIDEVCGPRLGEVRGWIAEGRYPPPLEGDLVPPDYLALVDEAGGIDQLRASVEGRYVIAADMFGVLAGPDELDDAWDAFLRRRLAPRPGDGDAGGGRARGTPGRRGGAAARATRSRRSGAG